MRSAPWLKTRLGVVAASDVMRVRTRKRARGKVKRAGNNLFGTIRAFEYRVNRIYECGRDAKGGDGVRSEVGRRGSDRQRSEPQYETETRGGEAAGYAGPGRGGDAGGRGARQRNRDGHAHVLWSSRTATRGIWGGRIECRRWRGHEKRGR
jgi:hypothetical protein